MDIPLFREIKLETGVIRIYGDDQPIELEYGKPDWADEEDGEESFFKVGDEQYFLSEFTNIHNQVWMPNPEKWVKEFDGILNSTIDTGYLIKLIDSEAVKFFRYACFSNY